MNKATLSLLAALGLASCTCNQQDRLVSDVVEKVIMTRRSIRNYKPQPVSRDTMTRILKAGINAPNVRVHFSAYYRFASEYQR